MTDTSLVQKALAKLGWAKTAPDDLGTQDRAKAFEEAQGEDVPTVNLPKVLVPILGHRNRSFRRRWIKANRRVWDLAWKHDAEVHEVKHGAD